MDQIGIGDARRGYRSQTEAAGWDETLLLLPGAMQDWGFRDAYAGAIVAASPHPEGGLARAKQALRHPALRAPHRHPLSLQRDLAARPAA